MTDPDVQVLMKCVKQKYQIPEQIIAFDEAISALIVKYLRKIPTKEVKRFYASLTLVERIQDAIKYSTTELDEKLPSYYI